MEPPKIYNIKDYGARSSDWLQTEAIQAAIDDCFKNGGGKVVIPRGIYRTATIRVRSNVNLHLEAGAILKGSVNPDDYSNYLDDKIEPLPPLLSNEEMRKIGLSVYPYSRWNNAIIRVIDAHDVKITGEAGSFIDGMNVYDAIGEENYRGPHAINVQNCENLYLEGYTISDSANWAHAIFNSKNITCRNVKVYAGHDGFDIRTCDNVLIEDCEFITGDDSIAGFDNNDVIIRRCILDSSCSALRFGGNHVLVEDCRAVAPASFAHRGTMSMEDRARSAQATPSARHNMLTFFLYYCDFRAEIRRTPGDIIIRNCIIDGADSIFALQYDGKHCWCSNRPLTSIRYENCTATGISKPAILYCDKEEKLTFELENVSITAREGYGDVPVIDGYNFECIYMKNVTLDGYAEPTVLKRTEGEIICDKDVKILSVDDTVRERYLVE